MTETVLSDDLFGGLASALAVSATLAFRASSTLTPVPVSALEASVDLVIGGRIGSSSGVDTAGDDSGTFSAMTLPLLTLSFASTVTVLGV